MGVMRGSNQAPIKIDAPNKNRCAEMGVFTDGIWYVNYAIDASPFRAAYVE
jgi:hypothetical protein